MIALALALALGCSSKATPASTAQPAPSEASVQPTSPTPVAIARRPFAPMRGGQPVLAGISYGPYRQGQRPGGPDPDAAQILEDLRLLSQRWGMLRIYSSRGPAQTILELIRDEELPLQVLVGVWIAPDDEAANAAELSEAVRLARVFPEQVLAVSVGNEAQVSWSAHRSDRDQLIGYIRELRGQVSQPVTTADDYNFWNKPESHAVADEVDFLLLHAYAMWNQQTLEQALPWTERTVRSIQSEHPDMTVVLGETGWATALNPEGDEVQHIKAPAGEAEQAAFHAAFSAWALEAGQPYFYFEAFDEPWKGSADPREVEKHWGLYTVDRTPKQALAGSGHE